MENREIKRKQSINQHARHKHLPFEVNSRMLAAYYAVPNNVYIHAYILVYVRITWASSACVCTLILVV